MKTIIDGAKQLLIESIEMIDSAANDVIIVGGWGPYIRHQDIHPGTKDVDLLFPTFYSKEDIAKILEKFLENGFFLSAKHDFQLCRCYKIGNRSYIYNVDLLHPVFGKINKVDFVEIMDLDISVDGIKVKKINTINIQYGDVMYDQKLYEECEFQGKKFNVLDASGIIISKIDSCNNRKRERDIFDIYLSLQEKDVVEKLKYLVKLNSSLGDAFDKHTLNFDKNWDFYTEAIKKFDNERDIDRNLLSMSFLNTFD
ncbi:MAG TPA: hypothetical protein VIM89_03905 [Mucilaginibacter sp.]